MGGGSLKWGPPLLKRDSDYRFFALNSLPFLYLLSGFVGLRGLPKMSKMAKLAFSSFGKNGKFDKKNKQVGLYFGEEGVFRQNRKKIFGKFAIFEKVFFSFGNPFFVGIATKSDFICQFVTFFILRLKKKNIYI